ncbi:S-layer homology domain-containing protein [Lachnospiraceae bacterium MD329]|nr:S-layer homology domain-containing protein [Lachnospiraceae bacterium MD329]
MKKRIISLILSISAMIGCTSAMAADYSDVSKSAWYYGYVEKISEMNAFAGYEDGTFRPENQITQEEFVKTVVCLINGDMTDKQKEETKETIKVRWADWAKPYFNKAVELGLITEQDGNFKATGIPCTRGNMAKLAARALTYLKEEPIADTSAYAEKIKDYKNIEAENKEYVMQAYAKGIISGYEDGRFRSDGFLTRAEASSVLVRLIDKNERVIEASPSEKLYDYFGRKVTWTEPLRTDVPSQYQVSIADHEVISQASYDRAMENGGSISKYELNRSKAMMFEDLVLQSITYENETLKLTVPDVLPQSQRWSISISYWDIDKDYDFTMIKGGNIAEPGSYEYNNVKVLESISIRIYPINGKDFTSGIHIYNGVSLSLERKEKPTVSFNNLRGTTNKLTGENKDFVWVQGQGYKDYIKNYQFDENDIEIAW